MKRIFATLVMSLLLIAPTITGAVDYRSDRESIPPAVDRLLAQDMVLLAEQHLSAAGFNPGPVDGVFDSQTQAALQSYQRINGLPETGELDQKTRSDLLPGLDESDTD